MSNKDWRRHADEELAVDDLLAAAGRAFRDLGVRKATMIDVARYAGCSRATLYRYFPNQEALHLGFVHQATVRIAAQLVDDSDVSAPDALTNRIMDGIAAVRADPLLSVWFEPENVAVPLRVSQNSDLLSAMSMGTINDGTSEVAQQEVERRAQWLLRSIVSLLAMPGKDEEAERAMVESFLVPVLLVDLDHAGTLA